MPRREGLGLACIGLRGNPASGSDKDAGSWALAAALQLGWPALALAESALGQSSTAGTLLELPAKGWSALLAAPVAVGQADLFGLAVAATEQAEGFHGESCWLSDLRASGVSSFLAAEIPVQGGTAGERPSRHSCWRIRRPVRPGMFPRKANHWLHLIAPEILQAGLADPPRNSGLVGGAQRCSRFILHAAQPINQAAQGRPGHTT